MMIESAIHQIRSARLYTQDLLKHIDTNDWFRLPEAGVTHIAWQVGHLAVAQYGLALKRIRGEKHSDIELISKEFLQQFGKGSIPENIQSSYTSGDDILAVLDRVHRQVLEELRELPEAAACEPAGPHPMFKTKLGALHWCAQHEFIHAGQIGLLRRLFGAEPLR